MKKDILVNLLMITFGLICITDNYLFITFPFFILFIATAFYWLTNTKSGANFINIVCGKN